MIRYVRRICEAEADFRHKWPNLQEQILKTPENLWHLVNLGMDFFYKIRHKGAIWKKQIPIGVISEKSEINIGSQNSEKERLCLKAGRRRPRRKTAERPRAGL